MGKRQRGGRKRVGALFGPVECKQVLEQELAKAAGEVAAAAEAAEKRAAIEQCKTAAAETAAGKKAQAEQCRAAVTLLARRRARTARFRALAVPLVRTCARSV